MPTYSYACTECGNAFDVVQAFTDDSLTECPRCGGRLRKKFGSVGVVFKGSGFYRNDSRDSSKSSGGDRGGSSDKSESKSGEKSGSGASSGSSDSGSSSSKEKKDAGGSSGSGSSGAKKESSGGSAGGSASKTTTKA